MSKQHLQASKHKRRDEKTFLNRGHRQPHHVWYRDDDQHEVGHNAPDCDADVEVRELNAVLVRRPEVLYGGARNNRRYGLV